MPGTKDAPPARVPERAKRAGVFYAVTEDGVELPVIDLTHTAFDNLPDPVTQARMVQEYRETMARHSRVPRALRSVLVWLMSRRSSLIRELRDSRDSYLPGLATYLLKLGPENLGAGYAGRLDRMVAASVPALSTRLRLRNMAHLMAEALVPRLQAWADRPLRMLNIAGGPALDSINALLLLHRDHPRLLDGRPVHVHVLDVDPAGVAFGGRAVDALRAEGGPLHKVDVSLEYQHYDWTESHALRSLARDWSLADAIVAASSEGGLMEYGADDVAVANLECLRDLGARELFLVASVTRDGPLIHAAQGSGLTQRTHPRRLEALTALVTRGGWVLDRVIENLMTFDVRLLPH